MELETGDVVPDRVSFQHDVDQLFQVAEGPPVDVSDPIRRQKQITETRQVLEDARRQFGELVVPQIQPREIPESRERTVDPFQSIPGDVQVEYRLCACKRGRPEAGQVIAVQIQDLEGIESVERPILDVQHPVLAQFQMDQLPGDCE